MKRFVILTALLAFIAGTFAAMVSASADRTATACATIARAAPAKAGAVWASNELGLPGSFDA